MMSGTIISIAESQAAAITAAAITLCYYEGSMTKRSLGWLSLLPCFQIKQKKEKIGFKIYKFRID